MADNAKGGSVMMTPQLKRDRDKNPARPVNFTGDQTQSASFDRNAWMSRLLDQIIEAVEASERTRYRIAKDSGISEAVLSRLVNRERTITLETLEALCDTLGVEITLSPKKKRAAK